MCPIISAAGKLFPGVFIFPLVKVSQKMRDSVPFGWIALANSSGWMTEDCFLLLLKHFRKQITCSPEKPKLVTMDNHISHMGYSVVMYAKQEGLILQTFPPHTSHAIQPLDRCVYGPLKRFLREAHDRWIRKHPGGRITVYDVPGISDEPIRKAFSEHNIKKAFSATGIYPFNRNAIPDSMYSLSIATDLPGKIKFTITYIIPTLYVIFYLFYSNCSHSTYGSDGAYY